MALSFFRRRQKMVVIIMAVLMVSFLIGPKVMQMGHGCGSNTDVIGTAAGGNITRNQLRSANIEIGKLQQHLGLFVPERNQPTNSPEAYEMHAAMGFIRSIRPEGNQALAYALLTLEAEAKDIKVSESELGAFFDNIGLRDEYYTNRVAEARADGFTPEQFRDMAARWLMVYKAYQSAIIGTPPSLKQLQYVYRDVNEKIKLRVLRVSAEDIMENATPQPFSSQEIEKQFKAFSHAPEGQLIGTDSFGFGYLQPNRVAIGYVLIDGQVISRVTRASKKEARDYYNENKSQFFRQVPIPASQPDTMPATNPASTSDTQPDTQPATPPIKYESRQLTPAEAMGEIMETLAQAMIEENMDSLANRAMSMVATAQNDRAVGATGENDYKNVLAAMVSPADSILNRTLNNVNLQAVPLDKAMDELAKAARIQAICYPWGSHGAYNLSQEIKVTLQETQITLGDALSRITDQVFGPQTATIAPDINPSAPPSLKWVMCKGFTGVLFPLGGDIEMFPLKIGSTDLLTYRELQNHALLGACTTAANGGTPLAQMAFTSKEFLTPDRQSTALQVGKDGSKMIIVGERRGRLIWRPINAVPEHQPQTLTPELRVQVVKDLRIKAAYNLAYIKANKAAETAREKGLESVAKELKLETFDTDMFSRKVRDSMGQQMIIWQMQNQFISRAQAMVRLYMARPTVYTWTRRIGDVQLPTARHAEECMDVVFSLVPQDPNKPIDPSARGPVAVFSLPALHEVLVMERLAYEPAVMSEFDKVGRDRVGAELMALRRWQTMRMWFDLGQVKARTGFEAKDTRTD